MCFQWNGTQFDTATMRSYMPSGTNIHGIHWTDDGEYVFVIMIDRWNGVVIRRADIPESDRLARQFNIDQLLGVAA